MVSQQRSLFRQLPQTVSQTSRVASPVDSSWGRIAEMASVSSGRCGWRLPYTAAGKKGAACYQSGRQVCDKPLVQPAAVQEQKGCAAQKQVDDSGDLEQTCPEGDERHQREQENTPAMRNRFFRRDSPPADRPPAGSAWEVRHPVRPGLRRRLSVRRRLRRRHTGTSLPRLV